MGSLFGGGSGGSSSQTTESAPWKPAQDALKNILAQAGQLFDKNGGINAEFIEKELADLTPEMQEAVKNLVNTDKFQNMAQGIGDALKQGNSTIGQATGGLGALAQQGITGEDIKGLAGELYDQEGVKRQTDQLTKDVQEGLAGQVQNINQAASATGNMGSSRAGVAEGVATGEAADAIATGSAAIQNSAAQNAINQAMGTLQGNQNTALGALGTMGSLGNASIGSNSSALGQMSNIWNQGLSNQLTGAGITQNQAQAGADIDWFNKTGQQNAGWDNLSKYLGIVGSIGGMGGSNTTTGSSGSSVSGLMGGLGGLMAGAGALGSATGWFSDASMKKKVKATGKKTKKGNREYEWEWNDSAKKVAGKKGKEKGVLAQEVAKKSPEAVMNNKTKGRLMIDPEKV